MKMIRSAISDRRKKFFNILSVIVFVLAYIALAYRQNHINPDNTTIPTLHGFMEGFVSIFKSRGFEEARSWEKSWFFVDVMSTGFRFGLSFTLAILISVVLGLLMGCFNTIQAFFEWPITFFAKITPTGALSVFFAIFGTNTEMFVAIILFGIVPTLTTSIMLAAKQMPNQYVYKAYTLGASTGETVLTIMLRYILPNIIDAIRLCVGPAIIFLIAAESLCADTGFGYTIRQQSKLGNMNVVFIYLTMLAIFGFAADWLLNVIQKKFCNWFLIGAKK